MSADLRTSLAMPTKFGPNLFEITALITVAAACTVKVKDTGDLLLLRNWPCKFLGPPSFRYQMVCAIYLEIIIPPLYLYVA